MLSPPPIDTLFLPCEPIIPLVGGVWKLDTCPKGPIDKHSEDERCDPHWRRVVVERDLGKGNAK